jgi:peptide-methionine (S)-S-oxide reductase
VSKQATFGAGCFWGVEDGFLQVPGVLDVTSGYSGGTTENPSYQQVCTGRTGHAEVVLVEYDPEKVSYEKLLDVFFQIHDPTQMNRQGPDVGTQYRSVIFTHDEDQAVAAKKAIAEQQADYSKPIATTVEPAGPFYRAEEYHQRYTEKNGVGGCHVTLKL